MRITVCELTPDWLASESDWQAFGGRLEAQACEWLLLPEMSFGPWLPGTRPVDPDRWRSAVETHDYWVKRLAELPARVVVGSRPVTEGGRFFNEGFIWQRSSGYRAVHRKYYLPDEKGFWEASWYERGKGDFRLMDVEGLRVGFLICTELWFGERARAYARMGVHFYRVSTGDPGRLHGQVVGRRHHGSGGVGGLLPFLKFQRAQHREPSLWRGRLGHRTGGGSVAGLDVERQPRRDPGHRFRLGR